MGSNGIVIAPASTITIEITAEKIGLSIKK
jgi:hypothetical protein